MRNTDSVWNRIVANGDFFLDTKLVVGDKEYTKITAPKISRKAIDKPLSVGACFAASMNVSIVTDDALDATVPIVVKSRVVNDDESSEYKEFGTFYINNREKSVGGMLTLSCFDSMLMANQSYLTGNENESSWPKGMSVVVQEIADKIGVEIDQRTSALLKSNVVYSVPYPKELTVMQVLGYIGACLGGNWIITEENRLRLILIIPNVTSVDTVNVPVVLKSLTTGDEMTVSGVSIDDGTLTYEAGTTDGKRIVCGDIPYACQTICNDLNATFAGKKIKPFSAGKARFDPAAELGDRVILGDKVDSFLMCAEIELKRVFCCDISSPDCEEIESEYPYPSRFDQVKSEVKQYTDDAVKDAIEETAENTDNMAVALGYYKTTQSGENGSTYTYYHNFPKLSDSTYIFYFGGNGMLWSIEWKGSHGDTVWSSSIDARGNMIMETLKAKKLSADLIEAGVLKSINTYDGENVMQFDLNNGIIRSVGEKEVITGVDDDGSAVYETVKGSANFSNGGIGFRSDNIAVNVSANGINLIEYIKLIGSLEIPYPRWIFAKDKALIPKLYISSRFSSSDITFAEGVGKAASPFDASTVQIRNIGYKVQLRGKVTFTMGSDTTDILSFPTDKYPVPDRSNVYKLVPCTGGYIAKIFVRPNGSIACDRISLPGSNTPVTGNITWLQLDMEWDTE